MIQRVQTGYLLFCATCLAGFLALPSSRELGAGSLGTTGIMAFGLAVLVASLVSVALYGRRRLQRKLIVAGQVLTVGLLAILYGSFYVQGGSVVSAEGMDAGLLVSLGLPLLAYVALFLARRAVTRDIRLVRSMDRLR